MRKLSMLLFAVGFVTTALVTVAHADTEGLGWQTINWLHYALAGSVGVAGVIGLRRTAGETESKHEKIEGDIEELRGSLGRVVDRLEALLKDSESISVYDVHQRIDDQFMEDLGVFADARESMIPRFGLQPYADIMSLFAGGERLLNRAWSASADGYVDETWTCITSADRQMKSALRLFDEHSRASSNPVS
ncbi:MAG: hypothetical protein ACYTGL_03865 [Planctomycetota bacterium]